MTSFFIKNAGYLYKGSGLAGITYSADYLYQVYLHHIELAERKQARARDPLAKVNKKYAVLARKKRRFGFGKRYQSKKKRAKKRSSGQNIKMQLGAYVLQCIRHNWCMKFVK